MKNSMTQEEHITILQQRKKKDVVSIAMEINKNYEKYVQGEDDFLEDIINALDKKYRAMVVHQLYVSGCYNDENEHSAMQEARMAVWILVQKSRKEQKVEPSFVDICKGIYYHKVMDVVRTVLTERTRFGEDYVDPRKKKEMKEKEGREECAHKSGIESIDRILPSENGTVGSLIADPNHNGNRPESVIEDVEKRKFFDKAFETYCRALMNSDAEPPRELALYYSRILPHILHICFDVETIPDKKAVSPKWAVEKMGLRTIGALSKESEEQLKGYISSRLSWCEAYQKQMDDEIPTFSGVQVMRNIIYVKQYDAKQIGHMADYMHEIVTKDWLRLMKKDPEAIENAIDYTVGLDKISKVLRGGLNR